MTSIRNAILTSPFFFMVCWIWVLSFNNDFLSAIYIITVVLDLIVALLILSKKINKAAYIQIYIVLNLVFSLVAFLLVLMNLMSKFSNISYINSVFLSFICFSIGVTLFIIKNKKALKKEEYGKVIKSENGISYLMLGIDFGNNFWRKSMVGKKSNREYVILTCLLFVFLTSFNWYSKSLTQDVISIICGICVSVISLSIPYIYFVGMYPVRVSKDYAKKGVELLIHPRQLL